MLLALALGTPVPADAGQAPVKRLTIIQSLTLRVRAHPPARKSTAPPPAETYREKRGPACIDAASIAGAAITAPDAVDVILKGGQRMRAKLEEECPALDYYSGFYVSPRTDGQICAGRDSIRTRSGGDCQIDRFRKLISVPPR